MKRAAAALLLVACGGGKKAPPAHDAAIDVPDRSAAEWLPGQEVRVTTDIGASLRARLARQTLRIDVEDAPNAEAFRVGFCRGLEGTELRCADDASHTLVMALDDDAGDLEMNLDADVLLNEGWEHTGVGLTLRALGVTAADYDPLGAAAAERWYGEIQKRLAKIAEETPASKAILWDAAPALAFDGDPGATIGGQPAPIASQRRFFDTAPARATTWSFLCADATLLGWPIDGNGKVGDPMRVSFDCQLHERRIAASRGWVLFPAPAASTYDGDPFIPPGVRAAELWVMGLSEQGWQILTRLADPPFVISWPVGVVGGAVFLVAGDELLRLEHDAVVQRWKVPGQDDAAIVALDDGHLAVAADDAKAYQVLDVAAGKLKPLIAVDPDGGFAPRRLAADGSGGALVLKTARTLVRVSGAGKVLWTRKLDVAMDQVLVAGDRVMLIADADANGTRLLDLADGAERARWPDHRRAIAALSDGTLAICGDSAVIALRGDAEVARVPLAQTCDELYPTPDGGVVASTGAEVIGIGPVTTW